MDFQMWNNQKYDDDEDSLAPHCGVNDFNEDEAGFTPRFVRVGKWNKTDLTYRFVNFDTNLSIDEVRTSFGLACNIWSKYSHLTFTELQSGSVDILIGFYDSYNDCGYCNRGFRNIKNYGHGFFPPSQTSGTSTIPGDIHFNKAVRWTTESTSSNSEIDFITVSAHELGHVLGLDHVGLSEALMHKSCRRPHRYLHDDDILGIQNLYGRHQ